MIAQVMFYRIMQKKLPPKAGISVVALVFVAVPTSMSRNLPKIDHFRYHSIFLVLA